MKALVVIILIMAVIGGGIAADNMANPNSGPHPMQEREQRQAAHAEEAQANLCAVQARYNEPQSPSC